MINTLERRVASAICRVLISTEDDQYRALDRLQSLAGMEIALETWLATKPDPEIVGEVLQYQTHRLLVSPMRSMSREVPHA